MQKKPPKAFEKPAYAPGSADNALRLLQLLRDGGGLRLTDAARELGVAPSTAHRLLTTLVYRGFAIQDEKRCYHPGPAMGAGPADRGWTREFTERSRPHLEVLSSLTGETANLVIRVGTQVRFLASAESIALLRVGDRQGQILPAASTAGGRVLLAELPPATLEQLYLDRREAAEKGKNTVDRRMSGRQFRSFSNELRAVRQAGFAINVEKTEQGVAAIAVAVHNRTARALGSVSLAMPVTRFTEHVRGTTPALIKQTVHEMEVDVADIG